MNGTKEIRPMNNINAQYEKFRDLVAGKNINQQTLLATDYLNHFNEIHMLLDMIADMPECLDDILEWETLSYQDHFKFSVFQEKELAIEAYNYVPENYKIPFEECVTKMDTLLLETVANVEQAIKEEELEKLGQIVQLYSPQMETLIEECSGIINGKDTTSQQDVIDDFFESIPDDSDSVDQNSIDDLFD